MIYACIALHNYIRITDDTVDLDLELELDSEEPDDDDHDHNNNENQDLESGKLWRDEIALLMWNDYVQHIVQHVQNNNENNFH